MLAVRISELCSKLSINSQSIVDLLPLFEYFRNVRNCIAHLDGTANKDLVESWADDKLQESIIFWNSLNRNDAPLLKEPIRGRKVDLSLANSIMASAVCYKIAKLINEEIPHFFGIEGYVHMAAYYGLMIDFHEYRNERITTSSEALISNYLTNRYYVKDVTIPEIVEYLKNLAIRKDCMERFKIISGKV